MKKSISAHHGDHIHENSLCHTLALLDKRKDIKYVEIDFVCWNDNYISSHDYNEDIVKNGSFLKEWLVALTKRNVVLWMDVKDVDYTIVGDLFSKVDGKLLFRILEETDFELQSIGIYLKDWVFISSQYVHAQKRIIEANINKYTIAQDLPTFYAYALEWKYIPSYIRSHFKDDIKKIIFERTYCDVVCLDCSFFDTEEEIEDLFYGTKIGMVILYNLEGKQEITLEKRKKVIYQYNFTG